MEGKRMDDTPKRVGRPAGKDPLSPDLTQSFPGFRFRLRDRKENLTRYIPALKQCAARGIVSSAGADPLALAEIIKNKRGTDVRTTGKKAATTVAEEEAHKRKVEGSFWEKVKASDPAKTFVLFQEKCAALLHRLVG